MAITFEEHFTSDLSMFTSVQGTVIISTDQAHSDTQSAKCTIGGDGTRGTLSKTAVLPGNTAGGRVNWWVYVVTASAGVHYLLLVGDTANGFAYRCGLTASAIPAIFDAAGTLKVSGGSGVPTGQWVRCAMAETEAFPNFTVKFWVNGTLVCTATEADFSIGAHFTNIEIGSFTAGGVPDAGHVLYLDDLIVDNDSSLTDPGTGALPDTSTDLQRMVAAQSLIENSGTITSQWR